MDRLDTILKEVQAILDTRNKRIELFQSKTTEEKAVHEASVEQAEQAFNIADIGSFSQAKKDAKEAGEAAAMYAEQVARLKNEPLLAQCEYENYLADIMADLAARVEDDKQKIAELVSKMETIRNAEEEYLKKGNDLLHVLQHEIMKDDACIHAANGNAVHSEALEKRFTDYEAIHFVNRTSGTLEAYGFKKA